MMLCQILEEAINAFLNKVTQNILMQLNLLLHFQ